MDRPPADWVPLSQVVPRAKARQARRIVAQLDPAGEQSGRYPSPTGGSAAWWVSPDLAEDLTGEVSGQTTGEVSGHESAEAWRELVATHRAEADRLRAELATERVARQEAVRRSEEAERARHSAELRQARLSGAWATWYATVRGLTWWRRRRLPDPPAETGQGLLNPPPAS